MKPPGNLAPQAAATSHPRIFSQPCPTHWSTSSDPSRSSSRLPASKVEWHVCEIDGASVTGGDALGPCVPATASRQSAWPIARRRRIIGNQGRRACDRTLVRTSRICLRIAALASVACSGIAIESAPTFAARLATTSVESNAPAARTVHRILEGSTESATLQGVSCPSRLTCMAVGRQSEGNSELASQSLQLRWSGSDWSKAPAQGNDKQANVLAVACVSATWCLAVGQRGLSPTASTFGLLWNGAIWASTSMPDAGGSTSLLDGVACVTRSWCDAVGWTEQGQRRRTLVEHWNGAVWELVKSPSPGLGEPYLSAVSCPSTSTCLAAGLWQPSNQKYRWLVERWNGRAWELVSDATASIGGYPPTVSCGQVHFCMVTGDSTKWPAWQVWDGTKLTSPARVSGSPSLSMDLVSVSCSGREWCLAAGTGGYEGEPGTDVAEAWNGASWRLALHDRPVQVQSGLSAVSCSMPTACTAVGWLPHNGETPLVERWNGTKWMTQPTPR
jgi:hypothetical protein